jgi:hypothetical protein
MCYMFPCSPIDESVFLFVSLKSVLATGDCSNYNVHLLFSRIRRINYVLCLAVEKIIINFEKNKVL